MKTSGGVIIPRTGERTITVGQTGSGKTGFTVWQLRRFVESPIVIYDAKEDSKFLSLKPHRVVSTQAEVRAAVDDDEVDYVIVRPPSEMLGDPEALDDYLWLHYNEFRGVPAYIDEAYMFHRRGHAFRGLIGLLTRGRSRGQTCMISTQRPAFISLFCFTEAQKMFVFKLQHLDDKKRMANVIPGFETRETPPKYGFYFFDSDADTLTKYGPVKLDPDVNTGYTDKGKTEDVVSVAAEAQQRQIGRYAFV